MWANRDVRSAARDPMERQLADVDASLARRASVRVRRARQHDSGAAENGDVGPGVDGSSSYRGQERSDRSSPGFEESSMAQGWVDRPHVRRAAQRVPGHDSVERINRSYDEPLRIVVRASLKLGPHGVGRSKQKRDAAQRLLADFLRFLEAAAPDTLSAGGKPPPLCRRHGLAVHEPEMRAARIRERPPSDDEVGDLVCSVVAEDEVGPLAKALADDELEERRWNSCSRDAFEACKDHRRAAVVLLGQEDGSLVEDGEPVVDAQGRGVRRQPSGLVGDCEVGLVAQWGDATARAAHY